MQSGKRSYTVFISSTFIDNKQRRKLVEDAVLRAGMTPVGMERFTASADPTVAICEQTARDCDLYVGIIAHRYGWIPPDHEVSITELEYLAAAGTEPPKPRLMFQIDEKLPIDKERDFDADPDRWAKQDKLDKFRTLCGPPANAAQTSSRARPAWMTTKPSVGI